MDNSKRMENRSCESDQIIPVKENYDDVQLNVYNSIPSDITDSYRKKSRILFILKNKKLIFNSNHSASLVVAPMVDHSDLPFRILCRKYGADVTYTQMLHSRNFLMMEKYRNRYFQVADEDRPLIAQFCGNDPDILVAAAKLIENKVDAIDLNLGCPQKIAERGMYGAFLLNNTDLVRGIVKKMSNELKIPLIVKIRKVSNQPEDTLNLIRILEESGASAICLHGRTKEEKCQFTGSCDWDIIKKAKQEFQIPIIANGGIENYEDIIKCINFVRADAVMSAEGILQYPALFSGNPNISLISLSQEYLDLAEKYKTPNKFIRGHLFKILLPFLEFDTDLISRLATARSFLDYSTIIEKLRQNESSYEITSKKTWYRRHFNKRSSAS